MNNPHQPHPVSPRSLLTSLYSNRSLITQITRRDVLGRYKGSVIGIFWSFVNPVLMLTVYTIVFSLIFKERWGQSDEDNRIQFALILFTGMIVHTFFAEILNRASGLIISHVNYVKKVVFPLEILPIMSVGTAFFHSIISLCVLLATYLFCIGPLCWTVLFIPCLLVPLGILALGCAWIIASLGVFLRDISQTVNILTVVMMFLAPVFYPVTSVPNALRPIIMANPLTFVIEQMRDILIWHHAPNWTGFIFYTIIALLVAWLGYAWFQKSRKWFADVL